MKKLDHLNHWHFSPDAVSGQTVVCVFGYIWINVQHHGSGIVACSCGWRGDDFLHCCGKPWNFSVMTPSVQLHVWVKSFYWRGERILAPRAERTHGMFRDDRVKANAERVESDE